MMLLVILLLPLAAGLGLLVSRPGDASRRIALTTCLAVLALTLFLVFQGDGGAGAMDLPWIDAWGLRFTIGADGISLLMLLLTSLVFTFIIGAGRVEPLADPPRVNALLLLTQSAISGVFMAQNAFLFYVFYELALVPVFFLLMFWGGERRRAATWKFFLYTVMGSLLLLVGLIYCYLRTPLPHSASFGALDALRLTLDEQHWLFWALFVAFAIKMPMFPFHSWQPEAYSSAPLQGTMVLAGVMLKMGIYGVLRLVFPIVPDGVMHWQGLVVALSLAGMLYAAVIAFRQNDLKRLVAWSSLSHVGLMCAGLFAANAYGINGALFQTLAHAVVIVALLYLAGAFAQRVGSMDMRGMGGIKSRAPRLAALFMLVMIASLALPLTQSFVGEWLMFNGLFERAPAWAAVGILGIVVGAIYLLLAYQRVMLGPENPGLGALPDASSGDHWVLVPLIAVTLVLGVHPRPVLQLIEAPVQFLLNSAPALMP